ncbi:hypothetical protein [Streptomyces sp. NBC_00649]
MSERHNPKTCKPCSELRHPANVHVRTALRDALPGPRKGGEDA